MLQTVLHNHGGSVAPAVHYLVAVLGDTGELPVSDDIGGLPQAVPDDEMSDAESPCPSPTHSIVVELEGCPLSSEPPIFEQYSDLTNCDPSMESLPEYSDVSRRSPPPPSYDSLCVSPVICMQTSCSRDEVTKNSSGLGAVDNLARKIRIRRRERKGYRPHGSE